MCGIFYCSFEPRQDSKDVIQCMGQITEAFGKIKHRGPDQTTMLIKDNAFFGFHRLAIVGLDASGNQPFVGKTTVMANAEIFNYKELINKCEISVHGTSDCAVIEPLFFKYGIKLMAEMLDGDFAIIIAEHDKVYVARDSTAGIGVRPLFFVYDQIEKCFALASEAKALVSLVDLSKKIYPVLPGTYMIYDRSTSFLNVYDYKTPPIFYPISMYSNEKSVISCLYEYFYNAVKKRLLCSDVPMAIFVSGGLDSSAVLAMSCRCIHECNMTHLKNIRAFTIAVEDDIETEDIKHAKILVKYLTEKYSNISIEHHIIRVPIETFIQKIPEVVNAFETPDCTTIRAGVANYLLAKYVKKHTDCKVVFSGEGSDELFNGYIYSRMIQYSTIDEAKSHISDDQQVPVNIENDTNLLLGNLYMYDVLRADRATSAWSLELRVPFLDINLINFVRHIDPAYKLCNKRIEKYILRKAMEDLMPPEVCWRPKEAFSDSVSVKKGINMVNEIKKHCDKIYSHISETYIAKRYPYMTPRSKEEYHYREIFEWGYCNRTQDLIKGWWMPPSQLVGDVKDPSATVLTCYNQPM